MTAAQERLPRLLALVPYLIARPGIAIDEAAEDLGVTPRQLRKDLELLWMCGLPGYGPGDLIDLSMDGDTVTVQFDAGMRRPLRLTGAEATALLVALRALVDTPGMVDADAVRRAVAKIEAAAGLAQFVLEPDARWVSEYYPVEGLEELEAGRLRVRMRYADTAWMVRLLLSLGAEVRVEEPQALRATLRERASKALELAGHLAAT